MRERYAVINFSCNLAISDGKLSAAKPLQSDAHSDGRAGGRGRAEPLSGLKRAREEASRLLLASAQRMEDVEGNPLGSSAVYNIYSVVLSNKN